MDALDLLDGKSRRSPKKKYGEGVDEELYFDSHTGSTAYSDGDVEQLFGRLQEFTKSYGAASASLVSKVQKSRKKSKVDASDVAELPTQVLRLVLNACEKHLKDDESNVFSAESRKKPQCDDMDRLELSIQLVKGT